MDKSLSCPPPSRSKCKIYLKHISSSIPHFPLSRADPTFNRGRLLQFLKHGLPVTQLVTQSRTTGIKLYKTFSAMKTSTLCRNKATEMSRDIALEQTLEVILWNFVFSRKPRKKGNCKLFSWQQFHVRWNLPLEPPWSWQRRPQIFGRRLTSFDETLSSQSGYFFTFKWIFSRD